MKVSFILENLFLSLPLLSNYHKPDSKIHTLLRQVARKEVDELFSDVGACATGFNPFGGIIFPYYRMGTIDSLNLFDLDELIIFSFYWINRNRYRRVLDIGANIGLHSIVLSKCGYEVHAYEPDANHFNILKQYIELNNCKNVKLFNAAVSNKKGKLEFTRVLGNTTGSHLTGSKTNPYGMLEKFLVDVEDIRSIMPGADLIKLDAEGHEKEILLSTEYKDWENTDALVEVESKNNADYIYAHFKNLNINLFAQKNNWALVKKIENMPTGYKEGTLFVTKKDKMPWK
jgi:FkbM family methyltransferase